MPANTPIMSCLKRLCSICGSTVLGITLLLLLLSVSGPAALAQSYTETTLYSFTGANGEGSMPYDGLTDVNGKLYGSLSVSGSSSAGTLFSFDPSADTEKTVYDFSVNDGATPYAGLTYDSASGKLYGISYQGGSAGFGALFSLDPGTLTLNLLYSFHGPAQNEGSYPYATLLDINGTLYGTTTGGGTSDNGTVFSFVISTHTFQTLHSFTGGAGGYNPQADLTYDSTTGKLYGTTILGGGDGSNGFGHGTIYSLDPTSNAFSTCYAFDTNIGDGYDLYAGLISVNGILYGTTEHGGTSDKGTLFSYNPSSNIETVLTNFTGANGSYPYADLIYDSTSGKLFGTTIFGGTADDGTAFSFDVSTNTEQVLYSFTDTNGNGENPHDGLLNVNGTLYGTTTGGGTSGYGTIFSLTLGVAPVAKNDSARTYYNTTLVISAPGVLGNDSNGGITTTAALVTSPTHGTITFNSDGSFVYVPNAGYLGTDSFTYKDTNAVGTSNVATCALSIQARTPIANNDISRGYYNTTLTINAPGVIGNDYPGASGTVTATLVTTTSHGTLTFHSDGSFVYKPTTSFIGTDSFAYYDTNSIGTSNTATCTINVQ